MATYADAITSLCEKGVAYSIVDNDYSRLVWDESNAIPKPSKAVLDAEITRLEADYAAKQYQRDRAAAYPSLAEQMDMQYWDSINGTTVWADTIAAIKAAHPKPGV